MLSSSKALKAASKPRLLYIAYFCKRREVRRRAMDYVWQVEQLIALALQEDLGSGDVATEALIASSQMATARESNGHCLRIGSRPTCISNPRSCH